MTIPERAQFLLGIVTNEKLSISAALAAPLAECQEWLKSMAVLGQPDPDIDAALNLVREDGAKKV